MSELEPRRVRVPDDAERGLVPNGDAPHRTPLLGTPLRLMLLLAAVLFVAGSPF